MESNLGEKLGEKNWDDLSSKLKLECIKWMEFETRWSLRHTTRSEKQLVESTKCENEHLEVHMSTEKRGKFDVSTGSWSFVLDPRDLHGMESILRMGIIDNSQIDCNSRQFEALREVSKKVPVEIRELVLCDVSRTGDDISILNRCEGLEKAELYFYLDDEIKFSELDQVRESICNINHVKMFNIHMIEPEDVIKLIENWIAKDKEEGSHMFIQSSFMLKRFNIILAAAIKRQFWERNTKRFRAASARSPERMYVSIGENKILEYHNIYNDVTLKVVSYIE